MILEILLIAPLCLEFVTSTSLCACATNDTKIHVDPNGDSKIIQTLITNECVTILNENDDWVEVKVLEDVGVGFVSSDTIMKWKCHNRFHSKGIRSTHQDGWKDWVQWNDCDATCGGGTRFRFRNCKNVLDDSGCSGEKFQTETCSTQNCPINGNWSPWGDFTACVGSCGTQGFKSATRHCTNPAPQFGGVDCQGDSTKYFLCYPHCSTTTAKPTTTTQKPTTAQSTSSPVETLKRCDKLGLLHALGNGLKIHHSLASACPDNTFTSPDSLVLEYCPMGRASTWKQSINVAAACNNDILHSDDYLPIASYHFSGLTKHSGIFLGCIPGGFKMAMQLCGHTAEIYHIHNGTGLTNVLNPNTYYVVQS